MVMATAETRQLVEYTNDGIPYGIRTLITEGSGPCTVDTAALVESGTRGYIQELPDGRLRVFAKAQHCGVKNRNGRVYPIPTWEQHLREGCTFMKRIGSRGVIGHLEHPDDGKSKMPLGAILVTEAKLDRETGEIWIVFETLSTPPGKVVEAYTRDRVRYGLSSRGNGSVVNEVWQELGERVDVVQDDYEPITWDVVIDESTPGAEVPASTRLREALEGLRAYIKRLDERAGGDASVAKRLLNEDTQKAVSAIDCEGGVCTCVVTESTEPVEVPPSGYGRYLLAFEDGSGYYRAYQGSTGQWEVWLHPHNLSPERLGTKIPTLAAAQQVAENHYSLVLAGGAVSAQQQAAHSNAIGMQARSPGMSGTPIQPNISGMAGQMGRYAGPVGPGPQTSRTPKVVLSFESLERARAAWPAAYAKLQEEWRGEAVVPYSGTVVALGGTPQELGGILEAVQDAGLSGTIDGSWVKVFTTYESSDQAVAHVRRVLEGKGFNQSKAEAVAAIREGHITEDRMTIKTRGVQPGSLHEYAPDKSAPGNMAGGDTVYDDEEVGGSPTGSMGDTISSEPSLEDPEDLDLDLDVNEMAPLGYDHDDEYDDYGDDEMGVYEMPYERGGVDGDDDMMDMYGPAPGEGMTYEYEDDDEDDDYDPDDYDGWDEPEVEASPIFTAMKKARGGRGGRREGVEEDDMYGIHEDFPTSGARKAFFGKMFGKSTTPAHRDRLDQKVKRGKNKGKKVLSVWRNRRKQYGRQHGVTISPKNKTRRKKKGKKNEGLRSISFARLVNEGATEAMGAVRVWVSEDLTPRRYEFYSRDGILEAVVGQDGGIIHSAINEAEANGPGPDEVWQDSKGNAFEAHDIVGAGFDAIEEEELKARHGGQTGVTTKGSEYMGKKGPEYSMATMNKPGDRGQTGDADKPGDYDKASEEGDGEYVKKGTMHGGGKTESVEVETLRSENRNLREKVRFLEGELSRYEDIVQEQHEVIREADEAREREALARHRAEALSRYPELAVVESTLKKCDTIEALNEQIGSCLSLVETVQSHQAPAPEATTDVLVERTQDRPRNGVSSYGVSAAPPGPLNESSTPFAGGPRGGGNASVIGGGTVASRVAAHRRRRRR